MDEKLPFPKAATLQQLLFRKKILHAALWRARNLLLEEYNRTMFWGIDKDRTKEIATGLGSGAAASALTVLLPKVSPPPPKVSPGWPAEK
jgi:hypothetical protein